MAWNTVTFACGHTTEKQLYGKHADRERYIAWAAKGGSCQACAKVDADNRVEGFEQEHGLPALDGSEKQIKWARDLRFGMVQDLFYFFKEVAAKTPADKIERYEEQKAAVLQAFLSETAAKFWIDNRSANVTKLARDIYKATRAGQ